MQSRSPCLFRMRENIDQKNSEYRHFLRSVFNSFGIFFDDQSHVDFLFYLVLVFTALRNSNNFFKKFNKLATLFTFNSYVYLWSQWVQPRAPPFLHLLLWWIPHICLTISNKENSPHHRRKKWKSPQGRLLKRSSVTVRKYTHFTKNEVFH